MINAKVEKLFFLMIIDKYFTEETKTNGYKIFEKYRVNKNGENTFNLYNNDPM